MPSWSSRRSSKSGRSRHEPCCLGMVCVVLQSGDVLLHPMIAICVGIGSLNCLNGRTFVRNDAGGHTMGSMPMGSPTRRRLFCVESLRAQKLQIKSKTLSSHAWQPRTQLIRPRAGLPAAQGAGVLPGDRGGVFAAALARGHARRARGRQPGRLPGTPNRASKEHCWQRPCPCSCWKAASTSWSSRRSCCPLW